MEQKYSHDAKLSSTNVVENLGVSLSHGGVGAQNSAKTLVIYFWEPTYIIMSHLVHNLLHLGAGMQRMLAKTDISAYHRSCN